jgi:hypothetical protein
MSDAYTQPSEEVAATGGKILVRGESRNTFI